MAPRSSKPVTSCSPTGKTYVTARRDFRWPKITEFNYALDWFDAELARGPLAHSPALRIAASVDERSFEPAIPR